MFLNNSGSDLILTSHCNSSLVTDGKWTFWYKNGQIKRERTVQEEKMEDK